MRTDICTACLQPIRICECNLEVVRVSTTAAGRVFLPLFAHDYKLDVSPSSNTRVGFLADTPPPGAPSRATVERRTNTACAAGSNPDRATAFQPAASAPGRQAPNSAVSHELLGLPLLSPLHIAAVAAGVALSLVCSFGGCFDMAAHAADTRPSLIESLEPLDVPSDTPVSRVLFLSITNTSRSAWALRLAKAEIRLLQLEERICALESQVKEGNK